MSTRIVKKGLEANGAISRTKDFFHFKPQHTLMLFDYDPEEGKPALSLDEVRLLLLEIMPELKHCEMLALGSTSSGVYREGEAVPEAMNGGGHLYITLDDGTKIPEIGNLVAARSWLKGYGRFDISKSGALLQRTLFDEAVDGPERLVFEAKAVIGVSLKQLPRPSKHWPGGILRTSNIKGLSVAEKSRVETLKLEAKAAKQPEADLIKAVYTKVEVAKLVGSGMTKHAAKVQIDRSNNGILTGAHPLQFAGLPLLTVADVLRDPWGYNESVSIDPEQSMDFSAPYRSMFFKNENNLIISTFRGGGGIYRLDKIEIKIDLDNPISVFDQMESAINTGARPDVFNWAGLLSYIGPDGALRSLTPASAPVIIGRLVRFYTMKKVKDEWVKVRAELSDKLWKAFLEKGSWNVPKLSGIVHAPYFYDGDVVQNKGYNFKSGLYLTTEFNFWGIKNATKKQALKALTYLRRLLAGFPFESATDEVVALAMLITAVQRPTLLAAFLFAITANCPGTGKTQLASGAASLSTSEAQAVYGFRDNEDEFSKVLMSALLQGAQSIVIDNVKLGVALGGEVLCTILTSLVYSGRELGYSRIRAVLTKVLLIATGNNLKLSSDVTRRSLMIRLDAKCERPELREFNKDFVQICREERVTILKSILTILSAYHEAGQPKVGNVRVGSFTQFSDEICAPLVWLGMVDPTLGLAKSEADEGVEGLGELLSIWHEEIINKVTIKELMARTTSFQITYIHENVGKWFDDEFADKQGVTNRKVGRFLSKYKGRVVNNLRLIESKGSDNNREWQVEKVK
jgi:hypothetical protein